VIRGKSNLKIILCLIFSIVLLIFFCPHFKKDMQQRPLLEKLGYTPQGRFYKAVLGEYRWFMGVYLSFKSIIYYGGNVDKINRGRFKELEFYNLYRTVETSVLLNPYNEDAYYFAQGAFTWGVGRIKEVNTILQYVEKYRKWDFKIPFFLGFNYAYFLKDYKKAAEYYKKASEISGSPLFTKLATRYFYEGGETELGITYLKSMIGITRNEELKRVYEKRLKALEAINTIEKGISAFVSKYGYKPKDIQELVDKGVLLDIPTDPYGGTFYIENGKVRTTSNLAENKGDNSDGSIKNK